MPWSYETVSVTLRPPRVVVVIDGDTHWSYWVRRVLHQACRVWGGASLAVVPHREGSVNPVLLRACQIFDPDYVVTYSPTVGDIEHFYPNSFQLTGADGAPLTGEEHRRAFEQVKNDDATLKSDNAAREQIAAVCSTYQSGEFGPPHEHVTLLNEEDRSHFPPVLDMPETWTGSILACPPHWGGILGVFVADHAGVAAPPERDSGEPAIAEETLDALACWVLGDAKAQLPPELIWHPTIAVGIDTSDALTANDRTMTHLEQIATGHQYRKTGLLVLGDTPEDFALARLWRLTFGTGHWLPSKLITDKRPGSWRIGLQAAEIARKLEQRGGTLAVTSMSLSESNLIASRDRLHGLNPIKLAGPVDERPRIIAAGDLPWAQFVTVGLAVKEQWDNIVTVPVTADATSTTAMAAPLPPPALSHPDLAERADINWHVDVQWSTGQMVRRRGIDSRELFAKRLPMMPTWARSSRGGITYQAQRHDFVLAGIRPENKLARVALRDLSLSAWVSAKGAEHGFEVRPSDAGRRAALLTRMLGGRRAYTDLFGGPLLHALRAMLPSSATTSKAYPDGHGVALSAAEGVLTFDGLCGRAAHLTRDEVRERVDVAARAGVIRRGLVLRCATCEQKQFHAIDTLSQSWPCQRCGAFSDLDQQAWKIPADEPLWFYDLHPVGRQVLRDNGDVSTLLSNYLRTENAPLHDHFDDVPEVEFVKDAQPQVELDLISYRNDILTVAECKTSGNQFSGKSARNEIIKKCRVAARLRADRLLFATRDDKWAQASRSIIENTVRTYSEWTPIGAPRVTLVAGLGTDNVNADTLSLQS